MATAVTMPVLGLTMQLGTIARWLKREGDAVAKDEPLLSVEMDKGTVDVASPADGIVLRIAVAEGQTVPVKAVIAEIGVPGETLASSGPPSTPRDTSGIAAHVETEAGTRADASRTFPQERSGGQTPGRKPVSPRARAVARDLGLDVALIPGSGPNGRAIEADVVTYARTAQEQTEGENERVRATPLARRLALEHGVPLTSVQGTGPGGRVTNEDVLSTAERRLAAGTAPAFKPAGDVQPLGRLRRITAERMAQSARSVARVTLHLDADFTEAARFRQQLRPELARLGVSRLPWDAIIAKAAGLALREHPELNAEWVQGQGIRTHAEVNIGIAVALAADGLVVPVLRGADSRSLRELAAELSRAVELADTGRLAPSDMEGGTFSITNLGAFRIDGFTPVVNPPQTAILGVGRIAEKAVVVSGSVVPRTMCTLSLTFDHRVVDGAPAAAFLARLADLLERPYALLGI